MKLRGKEISQNSSCLADWLSYFQNLNDPKPQFLDRIKVLDSQLSKMEKEKSFNELDIRERPFNLKGGGVMVFFSKKIF